MATAIEVLPVKTPRVAGGSGLKNTEVNDFAGIKPETRSQVTVVDWSAASATVNLLVAARPGRIVQAFTLVTQAVSSDGDGTLVLGSLKYTSGTLVTSANKYASAVPTASAPVGTLIPLTLAADLTFVQGEIITAGHTQKTGNGEGHTTFAFVYDDINPRAPIPA